MPYGSSSKVDRGSRAGASVGAGKGGVAGHGSGISIGKGAGPLGGKSVASSSGGIGSANAAYGTFSDNFGELNAVDAGLGPTPGLLARFGRMLGLNSYTNNYTGDSYGFGVDIGQLGGNVASGLTGVPGLGLLGDQLGLEARFGGPFGWRGGNSAMGGGAPGVNGGRGAPYGFGMRGPAAQPGVSASPASTGAPPGTPLSFGGAMQNPQGNYGLLNGYSANTRFGQGNLAPMAWGR